jgi:hypothetical protein
MTHHRSSAGDVLVGAGRSIRRRRQGHSRPAAGDIRFISLVEYEPVASKRGGLFRHSLAISLWRRPRIMTVPGLPGDGAALP